MTQTSRSLLLLAAAGLLTGLFACGGDKGCPVGTTGPDCKPTPTPTPAPTPITRVIAEGSGSQLRVNYIAAVEIRTDARGTLEAGVDWTFPEDSIAVYWTGTPCDIDMFNARECDMPAFSNPATTPKPRYVSVPNAEPGVYLLWIGNRGPNEEAVSFQVTLTTVGAARSHASVPSRGEPDVGGYRLQR